MKTSMLCDRDLVALPGFCLALAVVLMPAMAQAQLITMNSECRESIGSGDAMNASGQYMEALQLFESIVEECDTKDAAEVVQVGRAKALNGLERYADAIAAANIALEGTDNESLQAFSERAYAHEQMGDIAAATQDYESVIALTGGNQNVADRAAVYSKIANLKYRSGDSAAASENLAKAMELDPANADFYVQKADWALADGDYSGAQAAMDKAVAMGKTDVDAYAMRSDIALQQLEAKYGTNNAQQLRSQMTPQETAAVCADLKQALNMGLRDMQKDMFAALVCK